jgi:hypothetical protein
MFDEGMRKTKIAALALPERARKRVGSEDGGAHAGIVVEPG